MKEEKNKDCCIVTVCGKKQRFEIIEIKIKEVATKKGIFSVCVERETKTGRVKEIFRFDVWDETEFEKLQNIPIDSMVRVTSRPSNYVFTMDGKRKFSYDLTLLNVVPYSGQAFAEFAIRGKLVEDVKLGAKTGKPYMILKMMVEDGSKPVFIHVRHYGFSNSLESIGYTKKSISCEGFVKRKFEDGSFQFFATHVWGNSIEDIFVTKEENKET